MKNIFKLSALAVLAVGLLASCEEKEIAAPEVSAAGERTFTLTFAQPDTKVAVTDAGKTTWEVGDKILIHGEGESNKAVVTLTADNIKANGKKAVISFEGVEPYDRFSDRGYTSTFYAQYPADFSEEGTNYYYYSRFTETNGLLMAGYNEGDNIVFYNLCGVISFIADGDFDSYVFEGNNGETVGYGLFVSRLAGKGEGNDPVLEWKYSHTKDPKTQITGAITPGQVTYIGLPLGTNFTAGFKLALMKGEDVAATLSTDKAVNVERGKLLPLGDITSKLESTGVVDVDTWDYTPSAEYVAAANNLWKPIFDGNFDYVYGQVTGYQVEEITESKTVSKKESTYKFTFKDATEGEWGCCNFLAPLADHPVALKAGTKYNISVTLGATAAISKCIFSLHTYKADADSREGDWLTDLWGEVPANTPTTFTQEFTPSADIANIAWTIIPQFGTPAGMKFYIKDIIVEEVVVPAKFEWRVEADTLVNVAYNEAGAAHWYVEKDAEVEYVFKVYTDDGNVYTENGPGITIEPAANHVAINYAANDLLIPRKWMVTATTTANVEKPTLTAILIQGAYEYTDLAKLNADIIAAGDNEVERIVDLSAGVEITKISGKNVFAQNSTGGVLLYGTGLESKGMDANGGNAIVGKFVVKTKAFKGLPEITGVVSQSADAKIGAWSGQYPCFTRTIAQIEGEYAKYVNAKCKIVNVEVTKAFGQTKTGEIKDASGSLAIYNYSTDLTEDVPVGAKAEYAIVWPTVYNTHQLGFYKASQLKLTSCPGVVTVAATKSIAAGETFELGATTNSTGALSYASSDEAVATVSDAGLVTAVAAGTATITVSVAADGIYTAGSAECVVTVTAGAVATVLYSRVGAETPASWAGTYLMVYAKNGPQVLSSISDTSTKYGVGSRVTINEDATITQTDELKACEVTIAAASDGNADHYVMMFNGKYLTWTSGNSLNVADAESDNTRWTLAVGTAATGNVIITNVADSARQLWYNESSPRFACYTGKTETTSNYAPAQLFKLME